MSKIAYPDRIGVDLVPNLDSYARNLKTADWSALGAGRSEQFKEALMFFMGEMDKIIGAPADKAAIMGDFFKSHLGNLIIYYALAMGSHVFNGNESKAVQVTEAALGVCLTRGGDFASYLSKTDGRAVLTGVFMALHTGFGEEREVKRKGNIYKVKYTPFKVLFANIALHGGASVTIKSYETKVSKFCRQKTGMSLNTNLVAEILGKWDEVTGTEDRILAQYFQKMLIYEGRKTDASRAADKAAFNAACSRILSGEINEVEGRALLVRLAPAVVGNA